MGECRFDGPGPGCETHGNVGHALCTHAAAGLERRVEELVVALTQQTEDSIRLEDEKAHQLGDFLSLADAVSDIVWGGERGWETTGIPKLVEALRQKNKRQRDNLAHAEAREAALREALEAEKDVHRPIKMPGERAYCKCGPYLDDDGRCSRLKAIESALSPDAGRAQAAEVEKLREVAEAVKWFIGIYRHRPPTCNDFDELRDALAKVRQGA